MTIFTRRNIPLFAVFLGGALLTLFSFYLVRKSEVQTLKAEFEKHAVNKINSLQRELDSNIETVKAVHSFYNSSETVTRKEFHLFAASIIGRHPSVQALEWIPQVPRDERNKYEDITRNEGHPRFAITERNVRGEIIRAGDRSEYFPVYYVEPYKGNEVALGFDLASEQTRADALRKARDTGTITATGRITLVQETNHQNGFIVFIPVYMNVADPNGVAQRRELLQSFVLGVFRIGDIAANAWSYLNEDGIAARITDQNSPADADSLLADKSKFQSGSGHGIGGNINAPYDLSYSQNIKVADRDWLVVLQPTHAFFSVRPTGKSTAILLFGVLLTLIMAVYLKLNQLRAEKTQDLLGKYMKESEERANAEESLRKSEERFRLIAANIPDAIFRWSVDKGLEYVSPNIERITGYRAEDLLNDPMLALKLVSSQHPEIPSELEETIAGKPAKANTEICFVRKDGKEIWVEVKSTPLRDNQQRLVAFEGTVSDITDRKLAEKTLRENEEKFRILFHGINEGIIVHDPKGIILDVNSVTCERLKYSREELLGMNVRDIVSPSAATLVNSRIQRTEKEEKTFFETIYMTKDGIEIYCEVSEKTLNYKGWPAMMSVSRDVTDRKKAEKALRDSEERYRDIIEAITTYAYTVILKNGIPVKTTHCPGCVAVTGYTPEEFEADSHLWFNLVHGEDKPKVGEWVRKNLLGEKTTPIEHRIIRKDGQERWIKNILIPRHGDDETLKTYEGIIEDITERKLAELETNRNLVFQSVLNSFLRIPLMGLPVEMELEKIINGLISIPWLGLEPCGTIFKYDEAASTLILTASVGTSELLKYSCSRVSLNECLCGNAAASGEIIIAENEDARHTPLKLCSPCTHCCVPIKRNGSTIGVITLYTKEKNGIGVRELGFLWAVADIVALVFENERMEKDRNDLHEQLLHSQKMEAVGELAGGVAHDFNNMLTVIMGNAQLGTMGIDPADKHWENYDAIINAAERAKELTMKLLTFARKEKLNPKILSVNDVISDLVKILERSYQKKIKIKLEQNPDISKINADKNQVYQGLLNICNNAKDAMPSGGTLTIKSDEVVLDDKYCSRNPESVPGKFCIVEIADTGIGMSEEVKKRIFEPFYTTKGEGKGTGLGLSVTYGAIKNHGGFMEVDSHADCGTRFRIFLPASHEEVSIEQKPEEMLNVGGTETILIVDDEKSVLDITARMLSTHGYKTLKARDGKQALKIFNGHRSDINLVILDMIMPDMDGTDVYNNIRSLDRDTRIVLSSGFRMNGQISAEMNEDIKGYIQKPFKSYDLLATIRKAFDDDKKAVSVI